MDFRLTTCYGNRLCRRHVLGALCALAIGACSWGTRPSGFAPALGPVGALVTIRVRGEQADRRGELFTADSLGLTLRGERLVRVAWERLDAMDVDKMGPNYDVRAGESPSREKRARIALVSRFPQGLSGELLSRVLTALNQGALEEIR